MCSNPAGLFNARVSIRMIPVSQLATSLSRIEGQKLLGGVIAMNQFPVSFFIIFSFLSSHCNSQQPYSEKSVFDCNNTNETGASPDRLYTCNGEKLSCPAFLIFLSQSSYNSVTTISSLTSSNPSELARINNVMESASFPLNGEVIVPVTCSCYGHYYQANTSYTIQMNDTYYRIAYTRYHGLSPCISLMHENVYSATDLVIGNTLQVPLKCACPTSNQVVNGTKYLLTYLVTDVDSVPTITKKFNVSNSSVAYANEFSGDDTYLYSATNILVPLQAEPLRFLHSILSPPPFSPGPGHRFRKLKKGTLIGIGTGILVAVLGIILFLVILHCKRIKAGKAVWNPREGKRNWVLPESLLVGIASVDEVLQIYEFGELEAATEDFSLDNRLSASVYQGVLRGKALAIKKMSTDVAKEVNILKKINHFNLISLYGACEHHGVFYLVYEFMEYGSLRTWLHKMSSPEIRSWNHRIRMALDVAKGLHYIHNFTTPAYVHKDINSSNILLNSDLRAKIANFSLARSADWGENGNSSAGFTLGSRGYMAPEYIEACEVTPKMDVYAFGVILLELITGREASSMQDGEEVLLSEAVLSVIGEKDAEEEITNFIDPRLQVKHPLGFIIDQNELALRMVKLSVACLAPEPSTRLRMDKVVSTLMKIESDAHQSSN
ncbi:hypothetical protein RJ639_023313 [Escallonia herrerae]|uniref:Protein kinase domain-containing protein n=1 Tax=Escallonia herrerae TaxID=1293975 RepID=A0AA89AD32_9ASTE|nr:hypothetical protein RJ639_023313 [Escallonia herrerae]